MNAVGEKGRREETVGDVEISMLRSYAIISLSDGIGLSGSHYLGSSTTSVTHVIQVRWVNVISIKFGSLNFMVTSCSKLHVIHFSEYFSFHQNRRIFSWKSKGIHSLSSSTSLISPPLHHTALWLHQHRLDPSRIISSHSERDEGSLTRHPRACLLVAIDVGRNPQWRTVVNH